MNKINHIAACFLGEIDADFSFDIIENGLINKTFLLHHKTEKFILQNINTQVFKNPEAIANNIVKVNQVLKSSAYTKLILEPLVALHGDCLVTVNEEVWRLFHYVENTKTFTICTSPQLGFEAAKAFSEFYLPFFEIEIELENPLPNFIDFQKRIDDFYTALENASEKRKKMAEKEIALALKLIDLPTAFIALQQQGLLPHRVIHADCKISNILFSTEDEPLCIIDLDTMMSNTILYDFGDMIRSYTNTSVEDDISNPNNFSSEMYQAVKEGFLYHIKHKLQKVELDNLDYAAQVVVYIQAIRFLTDLLNGDVYYHTSYTNQNLNRTINQLNFLAQLLEN